MHFSMRFVKVQVFLCISAPENQGCRQNKISDPYKNFPDLTYIQIRSPSICLWSKAWVGFLLFFKNRPGRRAKGGIDQWKYETCCRPHKWKAIRNDVSNFQTQLDGIQICQTTRAIYSKMSKCIGYPLQPMNSVS